FPIKSSDGHKTSRFLKSILPPGCQIVTINLSNIFLNQSEAKRHCTTIVSTSIQLEFYRQTDTVTCTVTRTVTLNISVYCLIITKYSFDYFVELYDVWN